MVTGDQGRMIGSQVLYATVHPVRCTVLYRMEINILINYN